MITIEELKLRYNVEDAWRDENLEGEPSRSTRSPFREDRKPSFSVFDNGQKWKDHGTGESGDVFSFIQRSRDCSFREALRIVLDRVGGVSIGNRRFKKLKKGKTSPDSVNSKTKRESFDELDGELAISWKEGIRFLQDSKSKCEEIDIWRKWPLGTTSSLCYDGLISFPNLNGNRGIAFPVDAKKDSEWILIGIHFLNQNSGDWFFYPNSQYGEKKTTPLPFILGYGFLNSSKLLIITEGQWDCISFAAWSGWLDSETSWPEGIVCVGIRGAHNWRKLIEYHKWPKTASIVLIPDNDAAGMTWKGEFLEALRMRSSKVSVFVPLNGDLSDQIAISNDKEKLLFDLLEASE